MGEKIIFSLDSFFMGQKRTRKKRIIMMIESPNKCIYAACLSKQVAARRLWIMWKLKLPKSMI